MIEVCAADELGPGERKVLEVKGVEVGVFNVDGEFYALLNSCRHQHGPVCTGDLQRRVDGDVPPRGELTQEYYTDDWVVVCPWHGWAYDVRTGQHAGDPEISIPTYPVVVEDGTVYLNV